MVFSKRAAGMSGGAAAAVAALAAIISTELAHAFGAGAGLSGVGHLQNQRQVGASSFVQSRSASAVGRTGECSPTSLSSAYVLKPEMARSRGSEWRKLRTRGPGFGEKVSACREVSGFSYLP